MRNRAATPTPVSALLLLAFPIALATGCATGSAREEVYEENGVTVSRYARLEGGAPVERGFQHPAELSVSRIAYALRAIDVRIPAKRTRIPGIKDDPPVVRQAVPDDLLAPVARGLSKGFAEANSSEQLQVVATRRERKVGILHTLYVTTFVAYLKDDRLVVDLNYSDESLAKDEEDKRPNPEEGKLRTTLTLVKRPTVEVWPGPLAAVDYSSARFDRDEAEPSADSLADGAVRGDAERTAEEAAEAAELRARLSDSARAELDALETARAHGEVSEGYYRSRRAAILSSATPAPKAD